MSEERSSSATDSDSATIREVVSFHVIEDDVRSEDYKICKEVAEGVRQEEGEGKEEEEEEELVSRTERRVRSTRGGTSNSKSSGEFRIAHHARNTTVDGESNKIGSKLLMSDLKVIQERYHISEEIVMRVPEMDEVACSEITLEVYLYEAFFKWGLRLLGGPILLAYSFFLSCSATSQSCLDRSHPLDL